MTDSDIFELINQLSEEEEGLWARAGDGSGLSESERARLDGIKVELDRAYDLLHQREAKRHAGQDPSDAEARSAEIVERYQQ